MAQSINVRKRWFYSTLLWHCINEQNQHYYIMYNLIKRIKRFDLQCGIHGRHHLLLTIKKGNYSIFQSLICWVIPNYCINSKKTFIRNEFYRSQFVLFVRSEHGCKMYLNTLTFPAHFNRNILHIKEQNIMLLPSTLHKINIYL